MALHKSLCQKQAQPAPSPRVRLRASYLAPSVPSPRVQLRWVRIGGDIDLLDAPGIIPMSFKDQIAAQVGCGCWQRAGGRAGARGAQLAAVGAAACHWGQGRAQRTGDPSLLHDRLTVPLSAPLPWNTQPQRLAMCNDIGEASYVDSLVAAAFLETVRRLPSAPATLRRLRERYKLDLEGERGGDGGGSWGRARVLGRGRAVSSRHAAACMVCPCPQPPCCLHSAVCPP